MGKSGYTNRFGNKENEFKQQVSDAIFLYYLAFNARDKQAKIDILKTDYADVLAAAEFLYRYVEKKAHPLRHAFSSVHGIIKDYIDSKPSRVLKPDECGSILRAYISMQIEYSQRYEAAAISVGKDLSAYVNGTLYTIGALNTSSTKTKDEILDAIQSKKIDFHTIKPVGAREIVIQKVVAIGLSNIARASKNANTDKLDNAILKFNNVMAEIINPPSVRSEFLESIYSGADACIRKLQFTENQKDKINDLLRYIPNSSFDELGGISVATKETGPQKMRM